MEDLQQYATTPVILTNKMLQKKIDIKICKAWFNILKCKNSRYESVLLEIRRVLHLIGVEYCQEKNIGAAGGEGGCSWVLAVFCFFIWVLVGWVCSFMKI